MGSKPRWVSELRIRGFRFGLGGLKIGNRG
jgi:hypothetical protein